MHLRSDVAGGGSVQNKSALCQQNTFQTTHIALDIYDIKSSADISLVQK
jgi:hypothetical protein